MDFLGGITVGFGIGLGIAAANVFCWRVVKPLLMGRWNFDALRRALKEMADG